MFMLCMFEFVIKVGVFLNPYLHLLELSDVGVTLQLQVSHLVLMFLVLMEPLVLLPLLLLGCKLGDRHSWALEIWAFA